MTAPQNFALDRGIFNQTLYDRIHEFWFKNVTTGDSLVPDKAGERWFGLNKTNEQKRAFDEECRSKFQPALESVGPAKLTLPPFKSYEDDLDQASTIAGPFLQQVEEAQRDDPNKGTETLLSLTLLLDQMPRNIYRDNDGLKLVYNHYDRIAWALVRSSMRMGPNPVQNEAFKHKPIYKLWLFIPFMHSEHLPSHLLYTESVKACIADQEGRGDDKVMQYMENSLKFEEQHLDPIEKFGRFPHRNECLERQSTAEEKEHMKTGSSFGVKQGQSRNNDKDEL